MTPVELAAARDRVARAKLAAAAPARVRKGWTVEREEAGNAALAALRNATQRRRPRRPSAIPEPALQPKSLVVRRRCCVYCGCKPLRGGYPAICHAHSDLPALDDAYAVELILRGAA